MTSEFKSDFTPVVGKSYNLVYGEGNSNNEKIHVRAEVDGHFVIRSWRKDKSRWQYEVKSIYFFHSNAKYLKEAKR